MTTPNNAAALERLELISREMRERRVNHGKHTSPTLVAWAARIDAELATLRATLAQPDALTVRIAHKGPSDFPNHQCPAESSAVWNACCMEHERVLAGEVPMLTTTALTSQPSGEAVAARLTVYADTKAITARIHDVAHSLAPGTYDLYTHPSADAPAVNSSLRVAALALADLAERNTDDLDLWQAAIAAVRNAADAPGVAVDEWRPIESAPAGVPILVRYINRAGKERVIKARFIQRFTEESSGDCDEGVDEYDEANDRYTYCEGWWEMIDNWDDFAFIAVSEGSPTHWHKIPSTAALAPKQEGGHG